MYKSTADKKNEVKCNVRTFSTENKANSARTFYGIVKIKNDIGNGNDKDNHSGNGYFKDTDNVNSNDNNGDGNGNGNRSRCVDNGSV